MVSIQQKKKIRTIGSRSKKARKGNSDAYMKVGKRKRDSVLSNTRWAQARSIDSFLGATRGDPWRRPGLAMGYVPCKRQFLVIARQSTSHTIGRFIQRRPASSLGLPMTHPYIRSRHWVERSRFSSSFFSTQLLPPLTTRFVIHISLSLSREHPPVNPGKTMTLHW